MLGIRTHEHLAELLLCLDGDIATASLRAGRSTKSTPHQTPDTNSELVKTDSRCRLRSTRHGIRNLARWTIVHGTCRR